MATIANLVVRLQADTAELRRGVEATSRHLETIETRATRVGKVLAGAFSVAAVSRAVTQYAQLTGRIQDLSAKAGMGVVAFQKLSYAAKLNGVEMEAVAAGAGKLSKTLVDGNAGAVQAIKTLGLNLGDLRQTDPADAFMALGDAIARLPNPMQQSAMAMQLFGESGASYLPMFKGNLRATANEAERLGLVLSEDMVNAGDSLGDSLDSLKLAGMVLLGQVLTPMVPALTTLAQWMGKIASGAMATLREGFAGIIYAATRAIAWIYTMAAAGAELAAKYGGPVAKAVGINSETAKGLRASAQWYQDAAAAQLAMHFAAEQTVVSAKKQTGAFVPAAEALKKTKSAADKLREELEKLRSELTGEGLLDDLVKQLAAIGGPNGLLLLTDSALDAFISTIGEAIAAQDRLGNSAMAAALRETQAMAIIAASARGMGAFSPQAFASAYQAPLQSTNLTSGMFTAPSSGASGQGSTSAWSNWSGMGGQISSAILSAATGGGSVTKSVGSLLGGNLGTSLVSQFGKTITGALGKTFGSALNAVLPGIGSLIGTGIGSLVSKVGSWLGIGKSAGYYKDQEANKTLDSLRAGLLETYGSLDAIRQMGGAAGKELAGAWGDKSAKGLANFQAKLEAFKEALNIESEIEDLQSQLDSLKADQVATWDEVSSVAEKYGITLKDLGHESQQLYTTDYATELINDYETLTNAGANAAVIARGMGKELNTLVQDSLKFGTEIPANMRPVIESLLAQGLLYDAAGHKMTDLGSLKWGAAVETEADKIASAITDLIAQIDALIKKLSGVGDVDVSAHVGVTTTEDSETRTRGSWDSDGNYGAHGGIVHGGGIRYLTSGGTILPFVARGTDTVPAMLTPGEGVLSRRGMAALGALNRGQSGNGASQTIIIELDGKVLAKATAKELPTVLKIRGGRAA